MPCTPATVSSVVNCEANTLIAYWSNSSGADSYIATVQDSIGQITTCQGTTAGSCNVTGLGCGQIYHVSVVSSDGYCNSPATPVVDTPSGRKVKTTCQVLLFRLLILMGGQNNRNQCIMQHSITDNFWFFLKWPIQHLQALSTNRAHYNLHKGWMSCRSYGTLTVTVYKLLLGCIHLGWCAWKKLQISYSSFIWGAIWSMKVIQIQLHQNSKTPKEQKKKLNSIIVALLLKFAVSLYL